MQRFTANHPSVASIDAQLADLQREQSQLNARVATVPNTQQAAGRLLRDVDVNTGLYMNLMTSEQQLRVLKAGQQGNVRVVDYAVVAEQQSSRRSSLSSARRRTGLASGRRSRAPPTRTQSRSGRHARG